MCKKCLKWFIKAFFAGCFAFFAMTFFCMFYYNSPVHFPNSSGATDHIWTPNTFYSQCREGISNGKTNNEGFMNSFDYETGMNINVLIMGSSHMEAGNVLMSESTVSKLNALLGSNTAYNIGISGHTFPICCNNLESALMYYHPSEYVVIETSKLDFTDDELSSILDGSIPELADHSDGILGMLSKNPFLRLTYYQIKGFLEQGGDKKEADISNKSFGNTVDNLLLDNVLSYIANIASENETNIIICYHPTTQINSDGSLLLPDNMEDRKVFSDLCENNGIIFLDMTDRFQQEYDTKHILPHGFCNSSVGSGHLNKFGHEMIAEELYKIIEQ